MVNKLNIKDIPSNTTLNFLEIKVDQLKSEIPNIDKFKITDTKVVGFLEKLLDFTIPNESKTPLTFSEDDVILYIVVGNNNKPNTNNTKLYKIFIRELTYI